MDKYNKNDDLYYALEYNDRPKEIKDTFITEIVAEVAGANDELDWHWIVKLSNGKYAYLQGGCDYTGWDCQGSIHCNGVATTALKAAKLPYEEYTKRDITNTLIGQIKGKIPKFMYDSKLE